MPKLSIALINWNTTQLTKDCLQSIVENTTDLDYEVIVVDNGSTDGGIDGIDRNNSRVRLKKNERNLGLAAATNQAFDVARGEYFLLLNPDTIVHKDALAKMASFLDGCQNAGAVTCRLVNADGSTQYNMHRRFPSFMRLVFSYLYKLNPRFKTKWSREYLLLDCRYDKDEKIDQAGTCIMVKKKIAEDLGGFFDAERFPLFFNDVDLCYRLHKSHYDLYVVNDAVITHLIGQSIKKLNAYLIKKEHAISNLKFYKKHRRYLDYVLTKVAFEVRYSSLALYSFGLLLFRKTDWNSFKGWLSIPLSVLVDRKITL